jgi:dipeptidyl-peptidase-3
VSDEHWNMMLAYSAAVLQNCGNYKSFGDSKFVPELPQESFEKIIKASDSHSEHGHHIDSM